MSVYHSLLLFRGLLRKIVTYSFSKLMSACLLACFVSFSMFVTMIGRLSFLAEVPSLLSYGGNDEVCYISLFFDLSSITLSLFVSLSLSLSLSLCLSLYLSFSISLSFSPSLSLSLSLFLYVCLSPSQVAEGASILGGFGFEGYGIGDPLFVW